jgi:hypothetical protein
MPTRIAMLGSHVQHRWPAAPVRWRTVESRQSVVYRCNRLMNGGGRWEMGSGSEIPDWSAGSLSDDIRTLFEECLSKVRRQDPPASWKAIEDRIAALRERMDQSYGEDPAPTVALTVTP